MVHYVDRADDPRLADYARVGDHAWLRSRGLFVAESRLIVQRLFESRPAAVESILVTPPALAALNPPHDAAVYVVDPPFMQTLTGIDFHRGCLALARRPQPLDPGVLLNARRVLAAEGIGNPDNLGGLFRVAAAFGVDGLLLDSTTADPFYRKAIRTSTGSVFDVPFARMDDWPGGLGAFRQAGFTVVALTPRATAAPLADFAAAAGSRLVLMVGSEGPGLSSAALESADCQVRIPIRVDSLNVVVAAGIALAALGDRSGAAEKPSPWS